MDQALPYIQTLGACRVLDLCAGSGCIGLAVAVPVHPASARVLGEYSDAALKICRPERPPQRPDRPGAFPDARSTPWSGLTGLWGSFTAFSAIHPIFPTATFRGWTTP